MKLFTIGFTKKSAEEFFTHLQKAGVRRIVDIRLNTTSQIAGFAKARDLKYFLNTQHSKLTVAPHSSIITYHLKTSQPAHQP